MLGGIRLFSAFAVVSMAFLGCRETEVRPYARIIGVVEDPPAAAELHVDPPQEPIAALDGPCVVSSEQGTLQYDRLTSQAMRAETEQDWVGAVELTKQVVRQDCSYSPWWLKLAEFQMNAGRPADAVATLSAFDARDGNEVDQRLRDADSPLHALLEQEVYQSSELARNIAEDRKELEARRAAADASLARIERPPEDYIAKGACPFECCMYGEWTTLEPKTLYRAPESAEAIGAVEANQTVEALGGEMRLRPTPVLVRFAGVEGLTAKAGDIVFLLDYSGESFGNVWVDGEVQSASGFGARENCPSPNQECWGEVLRPEDAGNWRNGVWWIEIKTKDGTIGWTSEADHFTGADACG